MKLPVLTVIILFVTLSFSSAYQTSSTSQGAVEELLIDVSATEAARARGLTNQDVTDRDITSGVLRRRIVKINALALKTISDPKVPGIVRFNLFKDPGDQVVYDGVVKYGPSAEPSGYTLSRGKLQLPETASGERLIPDSSFSIISEKGTTAVNVIAPEGVFQILPVGEGLYVVEQDDSSAPFRDAAIRRLPKRTGAPREQARLARDDGRQIDVMVVYTTRAREHFGSTQAIDARIDLTAQLTNEALANSAIDLKVRLVHKQEIPWFVESYDFGSTLDRISDDSETNRLRNLHRADQVTLIRYGGNMWGIAYMLSSLDPAYESLAFSEIDSGHVASYYVFAHELGHNFGCAHDIDNVDVWGLYSYSLGYAFETPHHGFTGTIMSYRGDRILNYSSPDILYDGVPTGITGKRDNARTIRHSKTLVCNYRQGGS